MTRKLRAGVIGMGIGLAHARGYAAVEGAELVALCDASEARLAERGADYPDTLRFTDYRDMLKQADLDIVSVCVPNGLHAQIAIEALEAGLHVVCEKPLAADLAAAEAIAAATRNASGKLTLAYNKRYRADTQWLRKAYLEGTFGPIYHIESNWTRETGIPGGWFSQKEAAGGGPLIDLGVHVLDLALWVLDFPAVQTVSGTTRAVFGPAGRKTWGSRTGGDGNYGVEDGAFGLLRLDGGISMKLEASWADHHRPGEDDIFLRIAGEKAAAVIHSRNYSHEDTVRLYTEINGTPVEAAPKLALPAQIEHTALIAAFVRSIEEDTAPPAPVEQGLATVRVLDAFYRSAAQGREIVLSQQA
jgi:predicted dehydrogenase